MAALVRVASNLRAIFTAHVPLQLMDGRCLGPADDVERHGLMGVAAEVADLKVETTRVQGISQ